MIKDLVSLHGNSTNAATKGNAISITTTSVSRANICKAMCFALEHADLAFEVFSISFDSQIR